MKDGELLMLPSSHHPRSGVDIIMPAFRNFRETVRVRSRHRALAEFLFAANSQFSCCLYDG